jgi:hypothetical protein
MIYISGIAAEGAMGGSNVTRTATIITNQPKEVAEQILKVMNRGVTMLSGKGAYTGTEREDHLLCDQPVGGNPVESPCERSGPPGIYGDWSGPGSAGRRFPAH